MEKAQGLQALLRDDDRHKAAVALDAELKLELTQEQRDLLLKFVEANQRFPNAIEINVERLSSGQVLRSTLFPVTMLMGTMV